MTFPYHSAYYLFNADDEKPVEEFLNQVIP